MPGKKKTAAAAVIFTILVLTAVNVGWWWYYRTINIYFEDQMSERLAQTVATASLGISSETIENLLIEDIEAYAEMSLDLKSLAEINSLSEAAVIDPDFSYLVSTVADVEEEGYLLSRLNFDYLSVALAGTANASRLYEIDGSFLKSAYAPLYDSSGQVAALLVAEAGAGYFDILTSLKQNLYFLAGGSAGIIALLLIFYIIYNRRLAIAEENLFRAGSQAALGRMVAVVSHEVKNPLMILHAAGERLSSRYGDDEAKFIVEEVERLDYIVTGYLSFAKGANEDSIYLERIDLTQLLIKIASEFKLEFEERKVKLTCSVGDDACPVRADRIGLRQVVINLLLNGMEASAENDDDGDRMVRLELKRTNNQALITVLDNGSGIKRSDRGKLFEPFYTTKTKGSGLGLYMCRRIITMHDGTIETVDSDDNLTRFEIRLPIEQRNEIQT